MAITNEELSKQIQDVVAFVDSRTDEGVDIILDKLHSGAQVSVNMKTEDALKVFVVITVATVAGRGLWKGGEWLLEKYRENNKKEGNG